MAWLFRPASFRGFDVLQTNFEKHADGGGAALDAFAPAIIIDAADQVRGHRKDNPVRRLTWHCRRLCKHVQSP